MAWFRKKWSRDEVRETHPVFRPKKSAVQQRRVKVRATRGFTASRKDIYDPNANALFMRAWIVMLMLTLAFAVVAIRLATVALMPPVEPRPSIREMPAEALRRGNIYDRNGVLLATTLKVYSLYADPKRMIDRDEVIRKLPTVLPGLDVHRLKRLLSDPTRRFIWIKRRLTPDEAIAVNALGFPGLEFREEFVRIYPHRSLAGHILGAVDVDNNGIAGLELGMNSTLSKGNDIHLALDIRLQDMLQREIAKEMEKSESRAAWGVVMKVPTREIVAMVSLPTFDPNSFGEASPEQRFNHATLGSYEMGSTFKLFTLAQALHEGKVTPDTLIDCREPIHIGRYTIRDYHAQKSILTAEEVLRYSSNIGAAHIADMSGPEAQKEFLAKLGLLSPVDIGIPEMGRVQYPSNWGRIESFTIAFGHGISVTPIHLIDAVATLSDGLVKPPSLMLGGDPANIPAKKVLDDKTLAQIHELMRDVVIRGSGRQAEVVGYDIGGKTGTAEKIDPHGGYSKTKNLVSFVGVLPMEKPQYIVLVMMDEPKKGYETGGKSAAPVVGEFFRDLTQLEGIKPDAEEVRAYKAMVKRTHTDITSRWAEYVLSNWRIQRKKAGGVELRGQTVVNNGLSEDD